MTATAFIAHRVPQAVRDYLATRCRCHFWEGDKPIPRAALLEGVADAEGVLLVGGSVDDELLASAPRLRVVSNVSVGYNNLDIAALRRRGVLATHTPGVLDESVADLVMALMLATARRVPELDRRVRAGEWGPGDEENLYGVDVHGATLGIVGMGRIGRAVARRARRGFDMRVLYHNRRPQPEAEQALDVEYAGLAALLGESDFVLLMVPLSPQTENFMDASRFAQMKPGAIFINASRGATVDEQALIDALRSGALRGAGLDVFRQEPLPAGHPLTALAQVVTLPHIGSATHATRLAMAKLAARNLVTALAGQRPPAPVPELADLVALA